MGAAGECVVVEELLDGEEVSVRVLSILQSPFDFTMRLEKQRSGDVACILVLYR